MDIGSYRDLHRHRMMTRNARHSRHHGFATPVELVEVGLATPFTPPSNAPQLFESWNRWTATWLSMVAAGLPNEVLPVAEFRQLFWEAELRTVSQGHPDYRIEQEKYRLIKEKFPRLPVICWWIQTTTRSRAKGNEERIPKREADHGGASKKR